MVRSLYKHQGFFPQPKLLDKLNLTYVKKYLHMMIIYLFNRQKNITIEEIINTPSGNIKMSKYINYTYI